MSSTTTMQDRLRRMASLALVGGALAAIGLGAAGAAPADASACTPRAQHAHTVGMASCAYGGGYIRVKLKCARETDGRAPYYTYGARVYSNHPMEFSVALCRDGYFVAGAYALVG
jgi:hypothetical protein